MSGGGSGGGGGGSSNTTSTNTYIQDVPVWEQQYLTNLLGQSTAIAAQPYRQFPGPQVAGFTPEQTQAFSNTANLVNNGPWQTAQNAGIGSALAGAGSAQNIYGAGSPYIQAAANTATPQGIQNYLNPYTQNVVQGQINAANRNWQNNIMPSINDQFIGAGQYASGRNAEVLGRAATDFNTQLAGQVGNTLASGYNTAGQQAATQAGILGQAGSQLGNLAATQAGTQANVGTALGGIGQQQLNTGITAQSALQGVGQQQQGLAQQNLNVAQQNFQNQVNWPQQQALFLNNIIRGLPNAGGSTTQAQTQPPSGASPLSTIAGGLLGAAGVAGAGGRKRGGIIKKYAEGGMVDDEYIPPVSISELDNEEPTGGLQNPPSPLLLKAAAPSPLQPAQGQQANSPSTAPQSSSPLDALKQYKGMDPDQIRSYQLLAAAKGFLTPAYSNAEALGNALGNYGTTGIALNRANIDAQNKLIPLTLEARRDAENAKYHQGELGLRGTQLQQEQEYKNRALQQQKDYRDQDLAIQKAKEALAEKRASIQQGKDGRFYSVSYDETGQPSVKPLDVSGVGVSGVNDYNLPINTVPDGTVAPVLDSKFDITAHAPPTQRATIQNKWSEQLRKDQEAANMAQDNISRLNAAKDKIAEAYTGGFSNLPGVSSIFDTFSPARQEINSLNKELALAPGERPAGMRITQGEVFMLRSAVPGNDKSQEANTNIADAAIAIHKRPIEWAQFKNDFIANNGFWNEAVGNKMFNQYIKDNPVFDPKGISDPKSTQAKTFQLNKNRMSLEDYAVSGGFNNFVGKEKPESITIRNTKGQANPSSVNVPQAAIDKLKSNPSLASDFEKKYGVSAEKYLGQ